MNTDETMNNTIDALMNEEALSGMVSEDFRTAVMLKTAGANPKLDPDFDAKMEAKLLNLFAEEKPMPSTWKLMFGSASFGMLIVGALFVAVFFNPVQSTVPVETLAMHQGFESLSRAEVLLGELPADAVTEEGISVSEMRASIHDINVNFSNADTTLNPNLEEFAHVQLRDRSLALIKMESDFSEAYSHALADETDLIAFAGKVHSWPTVNEGVSFEVHAKAVGAYLNHEMLWEEASYELALSIVEEVELQE